MKTTWQRGRLLSRMIAAGFFALACFLAGIYLLAWFKGVQPESLLWTCMALLLGQSVALWRGVGVGSDWTRRLCGFLAWTMAGSVFVGLVQGWQAWDSWVLAVLVVVLIYLIVADWLLWFSRSVRLFFHEPAPVGAEPSR
jgi:hypothetical protein